MPNVATTRVKPFQTGFERAFEQNPTPMTDAHRSHLQTS